MEIRNNICKFITNAGETKIETINFVYETKNGSEMKQNPHHSIYLVTDGNGFLQTDVWKKELHPGMVFFTFSGIPFCITGTEELRYCYIGFRGQRAQELFDRFRISPAYCIFPVGAGLLSFWQNSLGKANEKNLDLISESVLLYTFSQLVPTEESKTGQLSGKLISYVENHFTDVDLTLESISEALHYHPKYVSRLFKEAVGISFSEYLKNTRIQHAICLMEQGVTSVKNVALLSGFRSPFIFPTSFTKSSA